MVLLALNCGWPRLSRMRRASLLGFEFVIAIAAPSRGPLIYPLDPMLSNVELELELKQWLNGFDAWSAIK